ncbi:MAG: hypothetical protein ACREKL_07465 [Chthoniobacterales bacterium]
MTWGTPTTISADTDVMTDGNLVWAYNFNFSEPGTSPTLNGVTFQGAPYNADLSANLTFGNLGIFYGQNAAFGSALSPYVDLSSSYQTLLISAAYWTGGPGTVTFNNLTIGQEYLLQLWVNDSRAGLLTNLIGRTDVVDDNLGHSSSPVAYNDGVTTAGGTTGQYVTGRFTATASTQLVNVSAGPGGDSGTMHTAQINGMQLRAVPEPAAWGSVLGFGLLILAATRRRRC